MELPADAEDAAASSTSVPRDRLHVLDLSVVPVTHIEPAGVNHDRRVSPAGSHPVIELKYERLAGLLSC